MRLIAPLLLTLALCPALPAQVAATAATAKRVLIISIDGGRPDILLRANTPNVHDLCAQGSFTFWARTVEPSLTLPSHASMITGVGPAKHGITWNDDVPEAQLVFPKYPTLFELAKKQGLSTAMAAGKSKFIGLCRPGSIDYPLVPASKDGYTDGEVAANAAEAMSRHRPQVMLVHFGGGDRAGHAIGWGSAKQMAAMEEIDAGIGMVIDALKENGLYASTLIIVTADHGGAGRGHFTKNDPRSRHIPWIAVGPGVRRNFDLTSYKDLVIDTQDTFATACAFLNIEPQGDVDGKPITQIFARAELMQDATTQRTAAADRKTLPTKRDITGIPATQPSPGRAAAVR